MLVGIMVSGQIKEQEKKGNAGKNNWNATTPTNRNRLERDY
jgi:hypothetical protein